LNSEVSTRWYSFLKEDSRTIVLYGFPPMIRTFVENGVMGNSDSIQAFVPCTRRKLTSEEVPVSKIVEATV
jgi:hypothetical protein